MCFADGTNRTVSALAEWVRIHDPYWSSNMRTLAALVVMGVVGAAPFALADAWRAKPALELGSPPACNEADVSNLVFDLADRGTELSVKPSSGEEFSAPIGPDGSVNTTFALPVGVKSLSVDLTGNVKTREMEVFNKQYSCRFTLTPVQ
jgi:hypothetical protein